MKLRDMPNASEIVRRLLEDAEDFARELIHAQQDVEAVVNEFGPNVNKKMTGAGLHGWSYSKTYGVTNRIWVTWEVSDFTDVPKSSSVLDDRYGDKGVYIAVFGSDWGDFNVTARIDTPSLRLCLSEIVETIQSFEHGGSRYPGYAPTGYPIYVAMKEVVQKHGLELTYDRPPRHL